MSKTCLVAQIGARMHYAVPRILYEEGRLEHFYTDICAVKGWPRALNLAPRFLRSNRMRRLLGRIPRGVPGSRITAFTNFGREYSRRLAQAITGSELTAAFLWAGRTFCEKIIACGIGDAGAVYTFNNAGLELMRHARENGRLTVMEQTIAPKKIEQEWLEDERKQFPEWESAKSHDSFLPSFIAREAAEWQAADVILCGSEFVRAGVAACGGPIERCRVVPYGVDSRLWVNTSVPHHGPLRVLTVGAVGLRKGSPYVLAAAVQLRHAAEFRMVGSIEARSFAVRQLRKAVDLVGPVPRTEMGRHFAWADVLLLPSLCEGSATVAYEALACGLPVIATTNTGTIVRDGVEGFIVPVRDVGGIVAALEKLAGNRDLLRDLSRQARRRSIEFDFSVYRKNLLSVLSLSRTSSVRIPCPGATP
jgi:glycosyltransferase involved in cell wall biosynthesis